MKPNAKTANKDIGQLNRMLKEMSIRHRLNLPIFSKASGLRGETERPRVPYETEFIQKRLLCQRRIRRVERGCPLVLYVVADTGLRPSEVVNLQQARSSWIRRFRT